MASALITGGAGFIGLHLAKHLASAGQDVTIADNFFRGKKDEDLKRLLEMKNLDSIECDLTDPDSTAKLDKYDFVYHLAAINGTRFFYDIPETVMKVNILSAVNVLEWFSRSKRGKILFSSSSETYAGTIKRDGGPIPTPEEIMLSVEDVKNPRWSYAISKIAGEGLFMNYARTHGFPMTIIRFHNIYGPRMGKEHVIPEFIMRAGEDPFRVYGGAETRAFCYVSDAVRAARVCMESPRTNGEIIHIGNDAEEIRIIDLARKILRLMDADPKIVSEPAPAGSVSRRCPEIKKLRSLGYEPEVTLNEGLKKTIDWYVH